MSVDVRDRAGSGRRKRPSPLRLWPAAVILVLLGLALASGVLPHLTVNDLRLRRTALKLFVQLHPIQSIWLYMAAFCAVVALSLPGALLMTLTGGVLFGPIEGAAAAMTGVTCGAIIMFLVAQTTLGEAVRRRAAPDGLFSKVEAGVRRHAFTYILFLRLLPITPIWLTNIVAGLVRTPFWIYVAATVLGIAPSTFIYASIGSNLDHLFAAGVSPDLRTVFQLRVFLPLIGLAALALTPIAYARWRKDR